MRADEHRCPGYPAERTTVRPCDLCRDCERWRQMVGTPTAPRFTVPPAVKDIASGVVHCSFYRAD